MVVFRFSVLVGLSCGGLPLFQRVYLISLVCEHVCEGLSWLFLAKHCEGPIRLVEGPKLHKKMAKGSRE